MRRRQCQQRREWTFEELDFLVSLTACDFEGDVVRRGGRRALVAAMGFWRGEGADAETIDGPRGEKAYDAPKGQVIHVE